MGKGHRKCSAWSSREQNCEQSLTCLWEKEFSVKKDDTVEAGSQDSRTDFFVYCRLMPMTEGRYNLETAKIAKQVRSYQSACVWVYNQCVYIKCSLTFWRLIKKKVKKNANFVLFNTLSGSFEGEEEITKFILLNVITLIFGKVSACSLHEGFTEVVHDIRCLWSHFDTVSRYGGFKW